MYTRDLDASRVTGHDALTAVADAGGFVAACCVV